MNPLVRRQRAVQATMARFQGKTFALGPVDCAKMTAFHLKQLGHKLSLSKAGKYRSLLGAQRALRRLGYETLPEAMDGHGFARIPAAAALIGDVVSFPCDHPIGALGIVVNGGNMLAFHESHEHPVIMSMNLIDTAWRVL